MSLTAASPLPAVLFNGTKSKQGEQSGKSAADRQDPAHPEDRSHPQGCESGGVSVKWIMRSETSGRCYLNLSYCLLVTL
jgi:hypothetical protein